MLFPHMPLGLHIFEERYRVMMRDCRERGSSFGIVAIREGTEVGGPARPYQVGTLAQLRDVKELEDGGYDLLVCGASRFRIEALSLSRPYLMGSVRYLQDGAGEPGEVSRLAALVRSAFASYVELLSRISGQPGPDLELPDDPELLSYTVAAGLEVETGRKQALLELDSATSRLRGCLRLLLREVLFLGRELAPPNLRAATVSLN